MSSDHGEPSQFENLDGLIEQTSLDPPTLSEAPTETLEMPEGAFDPAAASAEAPTAQPAGGSLFGDAPLKPDEVIAPAVEGSEAEQEQAEEEKKEKKPGLLARITQTDPFTVMLTVSLVALLIGIGCMLLEWQRYHWTTSRATIRKQLGLAPTQFMPASSTAAACPIDVQLMASARG